MAFQPINPPGHGGRPPRLETEPNLIDDICSAVAQGMFFTEAGALYNVHAVSIQEWMKWGVRDIEAGKHDTVYAQFSYAIKRAMAEAEQESITEIRRAGNQRNIPGAWQAHAWYLERKHPSRYGRQDRNTVELKGSLAIANANLDGLKELSEDDARSAAEILSLIGSGQTEGTSAEESATPGIGDESGEDSGSGTLEGD